MEFLILANDTSEVQNESKRFKAPPVALLQGAGYYISNMRVGKKQTGFTIVELLIVIVVIGILAALVLNSFSGAQAKARDAQRKHDVTSLQKAINAYYVTNGKYPSSACGSTVINSGWSTTADNSWQCLAAELKAYLPDFPKDPISQPGGTFGTYNYTYLYEAANSTYCGGKALYLIIYKLETEPNSLQSHGDCPGNSLNYTTHGGSELRRTDPPS